MPVKIKIIRAREFMQISPEDDFDLKAAKHMLPKVAAARRPPADYEILIDMRRAQWRLTMSDMWELVESLAEHDDAFKDKIALLALPGQNFNRAEMLELCARGAGYQLEAFTSFENAIHWLFDGGAATPHEAG